MTSLPCGATKTIRSTALAALVCYETAATHCGTDDGHFEYATIVATTHGEWQFGFGSERRRIDSSRLVLGNAGDSYACRHARRSASTCLALCLKDGALEAGVSLFDKKVIDAQGMVRLFTAAWRARTDDEFDSAVFTIFSEASSKSLAGHSVAPLLRIERAKRFIELHAFERFTLADLADELGLTPFTTIRQFKAMTGKTPHSYLLDLRLEAAMQLLRDTRRPVESIAKTVGFDDFAYFSRFFKRRTGHPPSKYRAS